MSGQRGVVGWGTYLPYRRLDRSTIAAVAGQGGGKGTRTVASFDEDPTTMAVEASRRALKTTAVTPDVLVLGTVTPAYADRTNANALHAALRLPDATLAFDAGLSARSAIGCLVLAARATGTVLVASADIRGGLAGSPEETAGGDAAATIVVGDDTVAPVLADVVATASVTAEFVDRWRSPGETRSKMWDERFAEVTYSRLGGDAWDLALKQAGIVAGDVVNVAVAAPTPRIAAIVGRSLGAPVVDDLSSTVGNTGAAQPALLLAQLLEHASAGDLVALVSLADGAAVIVLRATDALASFAAAPSVAEQAAIGAPISYGRFLAWRGTLGVEPPRRPEPQRVSATAAARNVGWKFGLDGSADDAGTIATFTVDRVAYSPSPPVVFAVIDFPDGRRQAVELTDCDADEVTIGMPVEYTFRRLGTTDGLVNYFWKARPVRG